MRLFRVIVCAAVIASACLFMAGCQPKRTINADAIDVPMSAIMDRHDAYVSADPELDEVSRGIYLRSTTLMRRLLDTAMERPTDPVLPITEPVADAARQRDEMWSRMSHASRLRLLAAQGTMSYEQAAALAASYQSGRSETGP
jgi:hypothetical protein